MSNSGQTTICHPFEGQPWTILALVGISASFLAFFSYAILRYCKGTGNILDFYPFHDGWRYRIPGWPQNNRCRGSQYTLLLWRVFNLGVALSCIIYQYLPIHYYSNDGHFNITEGQHRFETKNILS